MKSIFNIVLGTCIKPRLLLAVNYSMKVILKTKYVRKLQHLFTGHLLFFFMKFMHIRCFVIYFSWKFDCALEGSKRQQAAGRACYLSIWNPMLSLSFLLSVSHLSSLEITKCQSWHQPLLVCGALSHFLFAFTQHTITSCLASEKIIVIHHFSFPKQN